MTVSGVTLTDLEIDGDLEVGSGIGDGDVVLSNLDAIGESEINGGGGNSIHLREATRFRGLMMVYPM